MIPGAKIRRGRHRFQRLTETGNRRRNRKRRDKGQLARWVQEETGGDLFSIRVTEPYSSDWDECLDRANGENRDNIHPELEAVLESTADYDTVFIGYPNWWYSCPMAIFSFIDEHDLAGKDIYLFCSHGT